MSIEPELPLTGDFARVGFAATAPKSGAAPGECEDRIGLAMTPGELRAAVADGASASLFAGEWAERLANAYSEAGADALRPARIADLGADWDARARQGDLPWHAAAKLERGAYAALVGVCVRADGTLRGEAAGDSCAFLVRNDTLVTAFPVTRAGDFDSLPNLIWTRAAPEAETVRACAGNWESGDDLYLMTDALAEWTLRLYEAGQSPWTWLRALESAVNAPRFDSWVESLRASGRLRDDDAALIHIKLIGTPAADFAGACG